MLDGSAYPVKCGESHIVHRHPDCALPVVLALSKFRVRRRKTADAVRGPQVLGVAHQVQHCSEVWGRRIHKSEKKREKRKVATMAFMI